MIRVTTLNSGRCRHRVMRGIVARAELALRLRRRCCLCFFSEGLVFSCKCFGIRRKVVTMKEAFPVARSTTNNCHVAAITVKLLSQRIPTKRLIISTTTTNRLLLETVPDL